jgi:hypothetical protein
VLDLAEKLRVGQGLRLSDVMDGCGARQQELIQFATYPDVLARYDTIQGFLDDLDGSKTNSPPPTRKPPSTPASPAPATAWKADSPSSSAWGAARPATRCWCARTAATKSTHPQGGLRHRAQRPPGAEGEVLAGCTTRTSSPTASTLTVAGRTALLLKSAGARTLAEKLKEEGRLSLDMLQRFGEELIEAVNHLEAEGVAHRDIKPENIGIAENRTGKLQLVLFDFSLCRTPADNITAGTHPTSTLPVAAPAAALGPVRRALRAGRHAVRDGGRPAARLGRRAHLAGHARCRSHHRERCLRPGHARGLHAPSSPRR